MTQPNNYMIRRKLMAAISGLFVVGLCAAYSSFAGDAPRININARADAKTVVADTPPPSVSPSDLPFDDELTFGVFGAYGYFSGGAGNQYGYGGAMRWEPIPVLGLEAEYIYFADTSHHVALLNGVLTVPMSDKLDIEVFAGGGFQSLETTSGLLDVGGGVVYYLTKDLMLNANGRYVFVVDGENYTVATAGLRISF